MPNTVVGAWGKSADIRIQRVASHLNTAITKAIQNLYEQVCVFTILGTKLKFIVMLEYHTL